LLYLNGGMPRSGTVWVMNVIQKLGSLTGRSMKRINANTPQEVDAAIRSYSYGAHTLVHFHDVPDVVPQVSRESFARIFYNYRDPRDVVVSQMRLHDASLEAAIEKTQIALSHFSNIFNAERVLIIPYLHILESPRAVIHFIANHMGVVVKEEHLGLIEKETSFEAHREKMEKVLRGEGNLQSTDTGFRHIKHDSETFINDRHIQSGKIGRWKEELNEDQQLKVNEAFKEFVEKVL
jgi:hypothetical protein